MNENIKYQENIPILDLIIKLKVRNIKQVKIYLKTIELKQLFEEARDYG